MLVLARKAGEAVVVDGGIRVVVLACSGRATIGVDAPAGIRVSRSELPPPPADRRRPSPAKV